MASENETVESVIANARKEIDYGDGVLLHLTGKRANEILDRIGSAWRREKAELVECLKEAVHNQCYECRCKDVDGGCIGCCYKKWNDALRSANATVADGGES